MKTIQTRFGEVTYDPSNVLHFPEGLIGLDQLKNFIVMPSKKKGPLFWIQCVDDPDFAFVVTDPTNFFLDYLVLPDENERQKLGIDAQGDCFVLAIVSISEDKEITLNLSGPVLYAPASNRAMQVILEDSRYDTRTPLPKVG
ncbi:MAG: flagellar assembly protein FliW [Desulfobulbus sp.]|jgi:flagellar assembly factor FliW|uniref:flagellar assembly protein FliW n=1 Tax=Desulfobulbus sp. TaxID=895 RepID=UPI0028487667|nr:flagellar assembly protein FliW [Desulfobulbus sp.]MDR2550738.1 flagellar assembly protein FliW [Desulfobulbus sp.]